MATPVTVARARREVLLAAGSINSPKLLQLSGIGPVRLLKAHGISVVQDRPGVGRNLQDHLCIDHLYRARVPTLNQQLGSWHGKIMAGLQYVVLRKGPLALRRQPGWRLRTLACRTRPAEPADLFLATQLYAHAAG